MSTVYDDLGRWIDAHHAEQIDFLRQIVRVPSDTPPGDNAPAAEKAVALLTKLGFDVERHPVPAQFLQAYGMKSVTNLIVRHRFGSGGPTIALNAHGDVVPPGEGWTRPPYEGVVDNGRMYARGVAVSKSDIATYAYALCALRGLAKGEAPLNGTVELHFTYDEEFGGLAGPGFLLDNKLTKPDYAIAASFSYAVVTAHNGACSSKSPSTASRATARCPRRAATRFERAPRS
jgi:acetylornithine deacetylase/succinyl-diaminopimelate desuccinylase-like protein